MTTNQETPSARRRRLRRRAEDAAAAQTGVLSRRQLKRLGVSRWQIRAEIRARRWRAHGRHTVAVHAAELVGDALHWWAVFETGGGAVLAGATALKAAGLEGYDDPIHVVVRKSRRHHRPPGVVVHETRRLRDGDVVEVGVPRLRPAVAAVLGALWARTDRQGALLLIMSVNQRLTTADQLGEVLVRVRRDKRRRLLMAVLLDIADGVRSMGELDFARLCRRYGLPVPDRQVIRKGPNGRIYLDVYWDRWRLVVEIEGIHHTAAPNAVPDALRQNSVSIRTGTVLRIPVLGLRTDADQFMGQVEEALGAAGCPRPPRRAAA
jgi:hypothetical protein